MYLDWNKHVRLRNNIEEIWWIKQKCRGMKMIKNIGIRGLIMLISPHVIE